MFRATWSPGYCLDRLLPAYQSRFTSPFHRRVESTTPWEMIEVPQLRPEWWGSWQEQLRRSYTSVEELTRAGFLSARKLPTRGAEHDQAHLRSSGPYKMRVTPYYASLFTGTEDCPIERQVVPSSLDLDPALPLTLSQLSQEIYGRPVPWSNDPIGDLVWKKAPRITHRYSARAIVHLTSHCAIYCRFCFRKSHLNGKTDDEANPDLLSNTLYEGGVTEALGYVSANREIRELIFTGGDPLAIGDDFLKTLLDRIQRECPAVRVVRFHSRIPVSLPQRVTDSLLSILKTDRGFLVRVISHFNHPRELTGDAVDALSKLRKAGVSLGNQSVLLQGINAKEDILEELFTGLYEAGSPTMYLHYPDWAPDTFYFRPGIPRALELVARLRGRIPGAALPTAVLDLPGGLGKVPLQDLELKETVSVLPDSLPNWGADIYQVRKTPIGGLPARYLDIFTTR